MVCVSRREKGRTLIQRIPVISQCSLPSKQRRSLKWPFMQALLSSLIALTLLLASGLTSTASAAPLDVPQCQQQMVSVKLSSLSLTQYHVATWLCWRGSLAGKTVQVLVHGYTYDHTYDHTYWDSPLSVAEPFICSERR
jgi:hypothetical protein